MNYLRSNGDFPVRELFVITRGPRMESPIESPMRILGLSPQILGNHMFFSERIRHNYWNPLTGWWFHTFFSKIYGIILPIDFHIFQDVLNHQPADVAMILSWSF